VRGDQPDRRVAAAPLDAGVDTQLSSSSLSRCVRRTHTDPLRRKDVDRQPCRSTKPGSNRAFLRP
jgi:hypothetical protein